MKSNSINSVSRLILLTGFVAFNSAAMAENMSKSQYQRLENNLETRYESAQERCDALKNNAKDICMIEAKGRRDVSKAALKASFEPTLQNEVDVRIAVAEADYAVAVEVCDDSKDKSLCKQQALEIKDKAIANARAVRKTS
ncbi:MAG: hypothetical protein V4605_07135 [Pseudomonadota bacterium]